MNPAISDRTAAIASSKSEFRGSIALGTDFAVTAIQKP